MPVTPTELVEELPLHLPIEFEGFKVEFRPYPMVDYILISGSYHQGPHVRHFSFGVAPQTIELKSDVVRLATETANQIYPRPSSLPQQGVAPVQMPPPNHPPPPNYYNAMTGVQNAAYTAGNDLPHPAPGPAQDAAPLGQGGNAAPAQETQPVERILDRFLAFATAQLD